MVSTDFIVSLTYWPNLWQRTTFDINSNTTTACQLVEFRFSRSQPSSNSSVDGGKLEWRLVSDVRNEMGAAVYDEHVRGLFTLYNKNVNPKLQFKDVNDAWSCFLTIFLTIRPFFDYMPTRRAYYKRALKEFYDDGVQYVEIRASFGMVNNWHFRFKQAFSFAMPNYR